MELELERLIACPENAVLYGSLSEVFASDRAFRPRSKISYALYPLLNAAVDVINRYQDYWPLSVRQVHYHLLGPDAPRRNAYKPAQYQNTQDDYKALTRLLAKARLEAYVPSRAIDDETRPEQPSLESRFVLLGRARQFSPGLCAQSSGITASPYRGRVRKADGSFDS
jgi:hypothetical protein